SGASADCSTCMLTGGRRKKCGPGSVDFANFDIQVQRLKQRPFLNKFRRNITDDLVIRLVSNLNDTIGLLKDVVCWMIERDRISGVPDQTARAAVSVDCDDVLI